MWQIHIISYVSPVLYFSCHILHNLVNCTGIFVLITQWDPKCSLLVKILGSLCSCLLPEVVEVTTVKQLPEYHECSGAYILFSHAIFILIPNAYWDFHLSNKCKLCALLILVTSVSRRWNHWVSFDYLALWISINIRIRWWSRKAPSVTSG